MDQSMGSLPPEVSAFGDSVLPTPIESSSQRQSQHSRNGSADSSRRKSTSRQRAGAASAKRKCISTACIACRKRKSKCDGALPSCAACASVYGTECIYDPNSDHRRKGVYRGKLDSVKAKGSTLEVLIGAILNAAEDDVPAIVSKIRSCDSLDAVAAQLVEQQGQKDREQDDTATGLEIGDQGSSQPPNGDETGQEGEWELARKMGELRMENGNVRFIGGTSHLIYLGDPSSPLNDEGDTDDYSVNDDPVTTWTRVTDDAELIRHLMDMYFTYHYAYFTTLSRTLFWRDFAIGKAGLVGHTGTVYCSPLLVNAMLALGCHFTDRPEACAVPGDTRTKGDHFLAEAKRLVFDKDEFARPKLTTVQALALLSVHEAGCAREAQGWVYSGMSFRMAQDIGLNLEASEPDKRQMSEYEIDARKITFWGCFLFDKCWSNYLGRLPQIPGNSYSVSKMDVFPAEDAEPWVPCNSSAVDNETQPQPGRTRAVALQLSMLCEISSDLLIFFYHPNHIGRSSGKSVELRKLSELHRRLEEWRRDLPKEFEPRDGQLPNVILMHMFFHLQYIHLFRPFLKYHPSSSPLPPHVSPRRVCTANAGAISKLARLYQKTWGLRQICNIVVYMLHSACTIHLLNLSTDKTARRDICHGVRHLEEIAEDWLCARRTLGILSVLARKWRCNLPQEAAAVLIRADEKYGCLTVSDVPSPSSQTTISTQGSAGAKAAPQPATTHRDAEPLAPSYEQPSFEQPTAADSIDARMTMDPSQQDGNMGNMAATQMGMTDMSQMPASFETDWLPYSAPLNQQPPIDSFSNPFMPIDHEQLMQARQQRLVQPVRMSMDSQDWFLADSARLHQSFVTWDGPNTMNAGGGATYAPVGGEMSAAATTDIHGGIAVPGGPGGVPYRDVNHGSFESFGDSGWLPGLD